jgi:hypothetical protein
MPPLRASLAALLLLLLPLLPACEGPRAVAGHIRDGAGNPVPHAKLRTLHLTGEDAAGESDAEGRFSFEVFTSALTNRASVQVDAPGYHRRFARVPFREDVELVLVPDSVPLQGLEWSAPEWMPLAGAHYGVPLRLSYTAGVARVRSASFDDLAGWFAAGEGGDDGGMRARVGYLRFWHGIGGQLGPALLRTGSRPRDVAPHQTYAGAEARLHLFYGTFTIGRYRRIDGSAPGDSRLLSFGAGVGF